MRKIAKKYNLKYTKKDRSFKFKDLFMPDYKENIIEGRINDKDVLIYDRITTALDLNIGARTKSFTVITINGAEKQDNRVSSINDIDSILAGLV